MASRRTKSIGTKVTPDEYARIQALAGDQPVSEWVRAALLKAAGPPAADATVLAEVLALPKPRGASLRTFRGTWVSRTKPTRDTVRSWCRSDVVAAGDEDLLRTSERHAAKCISDTIGEVEIERMREPLEGQIRPTKFGLERQVEPQ